MEVTKAMIMAAGVGSRLAPLTDNLPKPLVPVGGVPVMDIAMERLRKIGIKEVVANLYYHSEKIIEHYKDNPDFHYVVEDALSGTAGGVKKCQFFFSPGEDFVVLSGDGLTDADIAEGIRVHQNSGAVATIGIKQVDVEQIPNFGVVVTDAAGFVTEFQEKPALADAKSDFVNTGIYIFNYGIFDYIPADTFYDFAKDVFPQLLGRAPVQSEIASLAPQATALSNGSGSQVGKAALQPLAHGSRIKTFNVTGYWSDIGTLEQYEQANRDVAEGRVKI